MPPYRPIEQRFWEKVAPPNDNGCMLWLGHINKVTGYGGISVSNRCAPAHRLSYELAHGPIPDGLQIDHLCRVRACVAPGHLEAVTSQINNLRSTCYELKRAKPRCKQGHERTPENTYLDGNGHRQCRLCNAEYAKRWYRRTRLSTTCETHGPKSRRSDGKLYCRPCYRESHARRSTNPRTS